MVQLPATAAIEYVAACWVFGAGGIFVRGDFVRGVFCPGGGQQEWKLRLSGGVFCLGAYARTPKFNAYTHRLGFLCLAS